MTPRTAAMAIVTPRPLRVSAGARIEYRLKVGPLHTGWTTQFEAWEPERRFVDVQLRGPFACWWHEHVFAPADGGTRMEDTVFYRPPMGPIGCVADAVFVRRRLCDIFEFRAHAIRLRFGTGR